MPKAIVLGGAALISLWSCVTPRTNGSFRVVPAQPNYFLRAPDASDTPFPDILSRYSDLGETQGWLLHPQTELHIENAYYSEGAPKHGIANFIGTEKAVYGIRTRGLHLMGVQSDVERRPADQLPVQDLIGSARLHYRYYRYFFQIVFRQKANARGAVLLGANSIDELDRLASRLMVDPDAVCEGRSAHCVAFPEACTVALEIEIMVNGAARRAAWGSLLDSIAMHPRKVRVMRLNHDRLMPVQLNADDPAALRLPLLPGDRIEWE